MDSKTGGLFGVIGTSIVTIAAFYVAIKYARPIGQIVGSGVQSYGKLARAWQN